MSAFDPDVLEKIKKLLARSASSEPHEAALALEMAQRLMNEHGLTTEQVEVGRMKEERLRSKASVSKPKDWELDLFNGVADAFGLGLLFSRGPTDREIHERGLSMSEKYAHYLFIGPAAEIQLAAYACSVLSRQLAKARLKRQETLPDWYSRLEKVGALDSYCRGWVESALSKVQRLVFSEARKKAIALYIKERSAGPTKMAIQRYGSEADRAAGREDGSSAELNRPVDGRGGPKALNG